MSPISVGLRALRRLCVVVFALFAATTALAQSTTVVISQVYGGGGGTSATAGYIYNQDYVEIFNLSSSPVDISGWSIQYAAATATTAAPSGLVAIPANTTLAAGQHYLIGGASGSVGPALPVTPDVTSTSLSISASYGKVYLVNSSTKLAASCPMTGSSIVDAVGFTASTTSPNCWEGTTYAPAIANTTATVRTNECTDTNENGTDFSTSTTAVPRNSSSTATPCQAAIVAPTITSTSFSASSVIAGNSVTLTAAVTAGTNAVSSVTADLSGIGGSSAQALTSNGSGSYSYTYTVPSTVTATTYTINVTATDSSSLTGTGSTTLEVLEATTPPAITSGTITAYPSSTTLGNTINLTATFAGNTSVPNGTVTIMDGTTVLGAGVSAGSGVWTYSTAALTLGDHSITAVYNADTVYTTAYTTPVPVVVTINAVPVADFNLILSNTSLTASSTQKSQVLTIGIQAINNFAESVSFSCSGLPAGTRCAFSPSTVTGSGTTTMTVAIDNASLHHSSPFGNRGGETALALGILALPLAFRRRLRSRLGSMGTLAVALVLGLTLAGITGCGSSATPTGSSVVTVTAKSTSYTKTSSFTLKVQ